MCRMCLLSRVCMPKSCATVYAHASFLTFAHVKCASTCVYLQACVKFKLSCTVPHTDVLRYYFIHKILGMVAVGSVRQIDGIQHLPG